ncbi:MAG: hypothetical protein OMM_05801 [Candidatus Magnetoglobus multicellularis str. Araruama]|uniref:Uncharacterized protein n=1 Tax=Candidatus Magnetoglobus multicellularis str. Araruama TaxID=890399 RepID=A0A1V1NUD5_9BACT|nr:MAG: hypothetical protein OMM_05801 [Candidatus Magnetoglobus multicellularis str. Araruama]
MSLPYDLKTHNREVPDVFQSPDYVMISKYQGDSFKKLWNIAYNQKVKKNSKIMKTIIVLVHPFYFLLRHLNLLSNLHCAYYALYVKNLIKLLQSKDNFFIVDSLESFLLMTNQLLTTENCEGFCITQHKTSEILMGKKRFLEILLKHRSICLAGCYQNRCVDQLGKQLNSNQIKYSIKSEACCCHPLDRDKDI